MIGLAHMAMRLAGASPCDDGDMQFWAAIWKPIDRDAVESAEYPDDYDYSARYYRIIDDIAMNNRLAANSPNAQWRFLYERAAYGGA